ncbi:unnamed protein product [Amoebophrya sp. A120]|nr:unnamed protein product [Amoebophrya sp. A120]|eukprot:GSA120T00018366001.1
MPRVRGVAKTSCGAPRASASSRPLPGGTTKPKTCSIRSKNPSRAGPGRGGFAFDFPSFLRTVSWEKENVRTRRGLVKAMEQALQYKRLDAALWFHFAGIAGRFLRKHQETTSASGRRDRRSSRVGDMLHEDGGAPGEEQDRAFVVRTLSLISRAGVRGEDCSFYREAAVWVQRHLLLTKKTSPRAVHATSACREDNTTEDYNVDTLVFVAKCFARVEYPQHKLLRSAIPNGLLSVGGSRSTTWEEASCTASGNDDCLNSGAVPPHAVAVHIPLTARFVADLFLLYSWYLRQNSTRLSEREQTLIGHALQSILHLVSRRAVTKNPAAGIKGYFSCLSTELAATLLLSLQVVKRKLLQKRACRREDGTDKSKPPSPKKTKHETRCGIGKQDGDAQEDNSGVKNQSGGSAFVAADAEDDAFSNVQNLLWRSLLHRFGDLCPELHLRLARLIAVSLVQPALTEKKWKIGSEAGNKGSTNYSSPGEGAQDERALRLFAEGQQHSFKPVTAAALLSGSGVSRSTFPNCSSDPVPPGQLLTKQTIFARQVVGNLGSAARLRPGRSPVPLTAEQLSSSCEIAACLGETGLWSRHGLFEYVQPLLPAIVEALHSTSEKMRGPRSFSGKEGQEHLQGLRTGAFLSTSTGLDSHSSQPASGNDDIDDEDQSRRGDEDFSEAFAIEEPPSTDDEGVASQGSTSGKMPTTRTVLDSKSAGLLLSAINGVGVVEDHVLIECLHLLAEPAAPVLRERAARYRIGGGQRLLAQTGAVPVLSRSDRNARLLLGTAASTAGPLMELAPPLQEQSLLAMN